MERYFISTPYIDAYQESDYLHVEGPVGEQKLDIRSRSIDFEDFDRKMRKQAWEWGEAGLGRALLLGEAPPTVEDDFVLAIGQLGATKYALVVTASAGWYDTMRVIEFDYPYEWNVT